MPLNNDTRYLKNESLMLNDHCCVCNNLQFDDCSSEINKSALGRPASLSCQPINDSNSFSKSDEPEESSSHGSCNLDKNGFYSVNNDFEFDECSLYDLLNDSEDNKESENKNCEDSLICDQISRARFSSNTFPNQATSLPVNIVNVLDRSVSRQKDLKEKNGISAVHEDTSLNLSSYHQFCGRPDIEIPENVPPHDQMFLWMQELTRRTYQGSEMIFGDLPSPRLKKKSYKHRLEPQSSAYWCQVFET